MLCNKIINYFAYFRSDSFGECEPEVVKSKFTMSPVEGKVILNLIGKRKGRSVPYSSILQVCYDLDSKMLYIPNYKDFSSDRMEDLVKAVKYRIYKEFDYAPNGHYVYGSPFELLRVRTLDGFPHAKKIIVEHFSERLPIIEANLSKMPSTVSKLPEIFRERDNAWGGYIGDHVSDMISFVDEESGLVHQQSTPFILINTSHKRGATEKEWVVLNSYREHMRMMKLEDVDSSLYSIKRLLYMGWSIEEISTELFRAADSIIDLFGLIGKLSMIHDPQDKYYFTFIKSDDFPISLNDIWDRKSGCIDVKIQFPHLKVIDYDLKNSHVILESSFYFSEEVCKKIFRPNGSVFMAKYNDRFGSIDVKYGKAKERQMKKISGLISHKMGLKDRAKFNETDRAKGHWASCPLIFNVRKISEYGYATDFIKEMCNKFGIPFNDFEVVVGPIGSLFGRGVQGGFMDANIFRDNEMELPFHLVEDIYIKPPVIFVNSVESPSYPEQTEVLIHEYRHYIYCIMNQDYKIGYDISKGGIDGWSDYLSDLNEIEAHKSEIGFSLRLGKTPDEIIREKVGGEVTRDNYKFAVKFANIVNEVVEDIDSEEELNEELT